MTLASSAHYHTCAPKAIPFTVVNPASGEPVHICINPDEDPPPYSAAPCPAHLLQHRPTSPSHHAHSNRSYWHPVVSEKYWRSALWLTVLNFPFALFVWVYTFVGTIVGTALLITMPLGVLFWWITLVGVRAFAKVELAAQLKFNELSHSHTSSSTSLPSASPVLSRRRRTHRSSSSQVDESTHLLRNTNTSVLSQSSSAVRQPQQHYNPDLEAPPSFDVAEVGDDEEDNEDDSGVMTPNGGHRVTFLRRTWYMFIDPYSYNALFYFLIPKACITLPLFIMSIVLLVLGFVSVVGLPLALRLIRRLAVWQRNVSREALQ